MRVESKIKSQLQKNQFFFSEVIQNIESIPKRINSSISMVIQKSKVDSTKNEFLIPTSWDLRVDSKVQNSSHIRGINSFHFQLIIKSINGFLNWLSNLTQELTMGIGIQP